MQPAASNISLSYDQVRSILEEWLNANLLRTSHQVVDIDYVTDRAGELSVSQFNIGLAPAPAPAPVLGLMAFPAISGNGSHPREEVQPAQPAEAPKRRSTRRIDDDTRRDIISSHQHGRHSRDIARQYGVGYSTVQKIIADQRSTATEHPHGD